MARAAGRPSPASLGFVFLELVWGQTGFAAAGLTPRTLTWRSSSTPRYTFVGMALFGVERWIDRGETFSQYFGMFASLSTFEVRDGAYRPPAASRRHDHLGAARRARWPWCSRRSARRPSTAPRRECSRSRSPRLFQWMTDSGLVPIAALRLTNSLFLLGTLLAVAGDLLGRHLRDADRRRQAQPPGARKFAHAFIPIALAYLVAHYFSLVVYQEQAQFTYLLSDPFGDGSDYFGTAARASTTALVGATAIWYVQFGAIVVGHVVALALGHDRALALWKDPREAAWSQVWMLVTMVFFSVLGLYLLSQANG